MSAHPSQPLKNIQIREILEHFRILVIGNANAGKTTILSKVCNGKIEEDLKPSINRGEHDIEDEIVYPTAHGFIFHDSRGFESGTSSELDKVKAFIAGRAKRAELKDQLHAIWYCLPTSGDRSLTEAEMSLFKCGTGSVPVIAIFTKMDAIDTKVFSELKKSHSFKEAKGLTPSVAKAKFEQDFLKPLGAVEHKPARIVELRNMNEPEANCEELVLSTAQALDRKALKLLLLSTHRNNVKHHIELAISQVIMPLAQETLKSGLFAEEQQRFLLRGIAVYFPHILPSFEKALNDMDRNVVSATKEAVLDRLDRSREFDLLSDEFREFQRQDFLRRFDLFLSLSQERRSLLEQDEDLLRRFLRERTERFLRERRESDREELLKLDFLRERLKDLNELDDKFFDKCFIKLLSLVQDMIVSLSPLLQVINFGAVFIIALEYSLYEASALSSDAFLEALDFILKAELLQVLLLELQTEFVEPWSTIDADASSQFFNALKAHSLVDINV